MNAEQQQVYEQFINIHKYTRITTNVGKDIKNIISHAAKHNICVSDDEYEKFIKRIVKGKSQSYLMFHYEILMDCCIIKRPTNAQITKILSVISFHGHIKTD
jgi:hypothetical protein